MSQAHFLPSAMKCSGTCKVTFTVSGQDTWLPHTMAKMQELTAISVRAVLFTGLFNKPGDRETHKDIILLRGEEKRQHSVWASDYFTKGLGEGEQRKCIFQLLSFNNDISVPLCWVLVKFSSKWVDRSSFKTKMLCENNYEISFLPPFLLHWLISLSL